MVRSRTGAGAPRRAGVSRRRSLPKLGATGYNSRLVHLCAEEVAVPEPGKDERDTIATSGFTFRFRNGEWVSPDDRQTGFICARFPDDPTAKRAEAGSEILFIWAEPAPGLKVRVEESAQPPRIRFPAGDPAGGQVFEGDLDAGGRLAVVLESHPATLGSTTVQITLVVPGGARIAPLPQTAAVETFAMEPDHGIENSVDHTFSEPHRGGPTVFSLAHVVEPPGRRRSRCPRGGA